jgi:hypothetical protein
MDRPFAILPSKRVYFPSLIVVVLAVQIWTVWDQLMDPTLVSMECAHLPKSLSTIQNVTVQLVHPIVNVQGPQMDVMPA